MMLRPRQKLFVERSLAALDKHGNTLGIAPTGAGKTIMLSAAVGEHLAGRGSKAAILAHRDELTAQNHAKFRRVNHPRSQSRDPAISGALVAIGCSVATPPIAPMFSACSVARSRI
jgi:superfamily II DNA or RNA helicase